MTVICDVTTCGYNVGGICCQKNYVKLAQGHCSYLIRYPSSYNLRWDNQELQNESGICDETDEFESTPIEHEGSQENTVDNSSVT